MVVGRGGHLGVVETSPKELVKKGPTHGYQTVTSSLWTRDVAELIKCLPNVDVALALILSSTKQGMEAHTWNPTTQEAEPGSEVQSHSPLYKELKANLGFMRSCVQKKKSHCGFFFKTKKDFK